ncbi:hypothetical protein ACFSCX_03365 [Bacillus salitolerans]|uniref:YfhD family protein n=1 Tax=Bacillus salitolerans TaxID=1437434 RepID=A0ABW4LLL1_9BACI
MSKWNNEAAPNNNLSSTDLKNSELPSAHEFAEELSDGMERNDYIEKQQNER